MTEQLYHADPYLRRFSAHIVRLTASGKQPAVVLDRTAFYATSGGQPNDTGRLNDVDVIDVVEDEATDEVVHVLAQPLPGGIVEGSEVEGAIDWPRRFDHMQQHTGQHILSQAFEQALDAPTVSFHLGADICTIDVQSAGLTAGQAASVEDMANNVVFADAPLTTHVVTRDDLSRFPLRKQPVVSGLIRIVEIAGFDFSPCGGTHVRSAGEVGLVKIRRWEKRGDSLRIDFHCGKRALLDYRWKNDAVNALANGLSVKDADVQAAVERSLAQGRDNFKALEEVRKTLLEYESRLLLAETPLTNGLRLIVRALDGRSSEEARRLAMTLTASPATIALLGVRGTDRASLIFARSADLSHDMNALLKAVAPIVSGRGGGSPSLAQGGGTGLDKLDDALQAAHRMLATG